MYCRVKGLLNMNLWFHSSDWRISSSIMLQVPPTPNRAILFPKSDSVRRRLWWFPLKSRGKPTWLDKRISKFSISTESDQNYKPNMDSKGNKVKMQRTTTETKLIKWIESSYLSPIRMRIWKEILSAWKINVMKEESI